MKEFDQRGIITSDLAKHNTRRHNDDNKTENFACVPNKHHATLTLCICNLLLCCESNLYNK